MQLLEFPPPKEKAVTQKNQRTAYRSKLSPNNTEAQALMQALAFNDACAQAEERQLRIAVMRKYLGQEETRH